jgi:predicted MFS family arabinose efflux permease
MSSVGIAHHSPRTLTNASWALRAQFFVTGAMFATWGVHVPTVKAHYGLGEQALAMAMLAAGVGSITVLTQAGRIIGRHGPRAISFVMSTMCALCIASLILFDSYVGLLALMLVYGVSASLFDVSINAEASEIERLSGRALMSGFHAMFSLGGMVGAGVGSALPSLGITPQQHLLGAALVCGGIALVGCTAMLRMDGPPAEKAPLSLPRGPLALIGLLASLGMIGEGAMYDWSVLYTKQEVHADAGMAALAYASFSGAMAAGRFAGDWVRSHLSGVSLLRLSGALGAIGMLLALLIPSPWTALLGFALVGIGFANVVPVLFSAAAKVPGVSPAHGIAAVSSVGYLGMMAGPPMIGVIAEASSLTAGLFVVVVFAAMFAVFAKRALP